MVSAAKSRILAFVHIARHGLTHIPEAHSLADLDVDATVATVEKHPEVIGIKVRACGPAMKSAGLEFIELAVTAARRARVPLMVHIGDANFGKSGAITAGLLPFLEEGDIVTHVYTGAVGRALGDDGRVLPELLASTPLYSVTPTVQSGSCTRHTATGCLAVTFGFDSSPKSASSRRP